MSVPSYRDLDKLGNDLLTKSFPINSFGFELQTKTTKDDSETTFKVTGTNKPEGQTSNLVEGSKTWKDQGLTAKLSCKTEKNATYSVELSSKNKFVSGLSLFLTSKFQENKNDNEVKATYLYNNQINAELVGVHTSKPHLLGSVVAAYNSIRVGLTSKISVSKSPSVEEYSVKVGCFPKDKNFYGLLSFDSKEEKKAGAHVYYKNPKKKLESSIDLSLNTNRLNEVPQIRSALQYQVDDKTTLKVRYLNTDSTVGLSVQQKLSDNTSATIATELKGVGTSGTSNGKFGLLLNLNI